MNVRNTLVQSAILGMAVLAAASAHTAFAATSPAPPGFIRQSATGGTLNGNEVAFAGQRIVIPVVAERDDTFQLHGRVNPGIGVPADVELRFELANNSRLQAYSLDVTSLKPPYAGKAHNLPADPPADIASVHGLIAATGTVPRRSDSAPHVHELSLGATAWFKLPPGTYHYVCASPDAAQCGIHGRIIARAPAH